MLVWSDKQGARDRAAWLLLVDSNGTVHRFLGDSIPEIVTIIGSDYKKDGKWSHTTYRLELGPKVRPIAGRNGWETGRFVEGLESAVSFNKPIDRWIDVANALGTTINNAQQFLREWRPKAAAALDEVEENLAAMAEATDDDFEVIAISFGAPTRRQRNEGYWDLPVVVKSENGEEIGRLERRDGEYVPSSEQIKLLALEEISGPGGGYVSMRIVVPAGATASHGI